MSFMLPNQQRQSTEGLSIQQQWMWAVQNSEDPQVMQSVTMFHTLYSSAY